MSFKQKIEMDRGTECGSFPCKEELSWFGILIKVEMEGIG